MNGPSASTRRESPSEPPPITITIDGPAGAGKSSVARLLARRLGLDFLDTGAMYRAIAWVALEAGINLDDMTNEAPVSDLARRTSIEFDWSSDPVRVIVDQPQRTDVTDEIRNSDVTRAVSVVASMPEVRRIMVERQRAIRDRHPRLVTEGRDQGSVVFPDAQVILYLDASPEERARRRTHQLRESGKVLPDEMSVEQVLRDLIRRDELDRSRSDGPLVTPSNALIVDTTHMDEAAVVDHLEALVRRVLSESAAESLDPDSRS